MDEATGDQPTGGGGAVADAAPVVTPVVAPVATAPVAPVVNEEVIPLANTGNVGLDYAIEFVGKLGVKSDDPAYKAAEAGDFDLLRVKLATMGAKAQGWEQVIAVAEKAYGNEAAARDAKVAATISEIHAAAGGEAEWESLRDWAKQAADPAERDALNKMLNGGPLSAKAAVAYLKGLYNAASDTSSPPASAVSPNAAGGAASSNGPVSPAEYKKAIQELSRKLGHKLDDSSEYATLKARRAAWRG